MTVAVAEKALGWSLFSLRVGVFIVMMMWTLNKFINPESTARVFQGFYGLPGITETISFGLGALQAAVIVAFLAGFKKRYSIGIVFLMHLVSTLASFGKYLDPWTSPNLLFFTAWPMLAAVLTLYLLRDYDTLFSLGGKSEAHTES